LRHEGGEEQDALRIEEGDQESLADHAMRGRQDGAFAQRRDRRAPELDAEIEQIERAREFQQHEKLGRDGEQGAHTQERKRDRGDIAERHADHAEEGGARAGGESEPHHQQHGRAGNHDQAGRGQGEGKPELDRHGFSLFLRRRATSGKASHGRARAVKPLGPAGAGPRAQSRVSACSLTKRSRSAIGLGSS
jgi:hypothetical protein